ncbi:MAG: hypothetical protein IJ567_05235 [Lachnospiraceae bacterium]|nr:hypothetical protein [Lachnospiraceae bacterium]
MPTTAQAANCGLGSVQKIQCSSYEDLCKQLQEQCGNLPGSSCVQGAYVQGNGSTCSPQIRSIQDLADILQGNVSLPQGSCTTQNGSTVAPSGSCGTSNGNSSAPQSSTENDSCTTQNGSCTPSKSGCTTQNGSCTALDNSCSTSGDCTTPQSTTKNDSCTTQNGSCTPSKSGCTTQNGSCTASDNSCSTSGDCTTPQSTTKNDSCTTRNGSCTPSQSSTKNDNNTVSENSGTSRTSDETTQKIDTAPQTGQTDVVKEAEPETETVQEVANVSYVRQVAGLVNEERTKRGLKGLKFDESIAAVADVRGSEIQRSFSHTRPDGSRFYTALLQGNVSYRHCGENIAWGQKTPEEVVNAWMNSEGHRANILSANYTRIGVSYTQNGNGTPYWVQLFAD